MFKFDIGKYSVGTFCGARLWSFSDWKTYGLFERLPGVGFSVGPILFWEE